MSRNWTFGAALAGLCCAFAAQSSAGVVELISNGDFEAGFAGWTKAVQAGSAGDYFANPVAPGGTATAINGFPVPGDTDMDNGALAAISDQVGPNAVALAQAFIVPLGTTKLELTFESFINDFSSLSPIGPAFPAMPGLLGPALDLTILESQFALMDILGPGADPLMPLPDDVVTSIANPFPAPTFPPGGNPWTDSPVFDLTGSLVPGGTYQLRFGEVDTEGNFIVGFDNVSLKATTVVPLPPALLLLAGAVTGLGALRANRRAG